ncbi:MAG: YlxR family protein [Anaerolineae bacterium]|nr:YlxR family protein [Anaerolineae bacterium]
MVKVKRKPKQRHIPERTCIACRTKRPKRDLVRVVRAAAGGVLVDETGKRNGRGAYLCRQRECWEQALRRGSLNRALDATLNTDEIAALQAYAAALPGTPVTAQETLALSGPKQEVEHE